MSMNATVQLTGFLGEDAKRISKEGKSYTILSIATTDSYLVEENEQTKWVNKNPVWHDVFVFNPKAVSIANDLKKGEKVNLNGSLSYNEI